MRRALRSLRRLRRQRGPLACALQNLPPKPWHLEPCDYPAQTLASHRYGLGDVDFLNNQSAHARLATTFHCYNCERPGAAGRFATPRAVLDALQL